MHDEKVPWHWLNRAEMVSGNQEQTWLFKFHISSSHPSRLLPALQLRRKLLWRWAWTQHLKVIALTCCYRPMQDRNRELLTCDHIFFQRKNKGLQEDTSHRSDPPIKTRSNTDQKHRWFLHQALQVQGKVVWALSPLESLKVWDLEEIK